jgi:hypothetical protein
MPRRAAPQVRALSRAAVAAQRRHARRDAGSDRRTGVRELNPAKTVRACVSTPVSMCVRACARVRACVRECARVRVHACVCRCRALAAGRSRQLCRCRCARCAVHKPGCPRSPHAQPAPARCAGTRTCRNGSRLSSRRRSARSRPYSGEHSARLIAAARAPLSFRLPLHPVLCCASGRMALFCRRCA